MRVDDPTSVALSLPSRLGQSWTVREVEQLQVQAAAVSREGAEGAGGDTAAAAASDRLVSGRYRSAGGDMELELRIDIDGVRPTRCISGDFFRRTGGTTAYTGSFVLKSPNLSVTGGSVVATGRGVFSFQSSSPRLKVTIPAAGPTEPQPAATAQFLTDGGIPGASFTCGFESRYFRTLEFELDSVESVSAFQSYDTGAHPSGGGARTLTVPTAFGEAGIEMVGAEVGDPVPISLAGPDRIWTNRELHTAMQDQFAEWTTDPAWRVWLLAATIHEDGDGLRGIMFDADKRQGCAVFHDVIGGTDSRTVRAMLRTYVHELGHCFNLYHSHHKEFMNPPQANRLDALSWMHYPAYFRRGTASGEAAYWRAFPFQFDDDEIVHLRHGFRDAVIPGGQPFGLGAADVDPHLFADPVADESGLRLELRAPDRFLLGTPVVIELKLSLTDLRGRTVNAALHPKKGYVQIGISRLDGRTVTYRPLITECAEPDLVQLTGKTPAVYESAYIGYGKDGFYFGSPGDYELRALYNAPDGSVVTSNRLRLRIKPPISADDEEVADHFFGDDQGTLLYLLGSDDDRLKNGRNALRAVREQFASHPLSSYACLVEGMSSSRPFKRIPVKHTAERKVLVRSADLEGAAALLSTVVNATRREAEVTPGAAAERGEARGASVPRLDNISLNMVMRRLADVRATMGDHDRADDTLRGMWDFFSRIAKVPEPVREKIQGEISTMVGEARAEEMCSAEPSRGE